MKPGVNRKKWPSPVAYRFLRVGSYRAVIAAKNAGGDSQLRYVRFSVTGG